jgi:hypothetical protein
MNQQLQFTLKNSSIANFASTDSLQENTTPIRNYFVIDLHYAEVVIFVKPYAGYRTSQMMAVNDSADCCEFTVSFSTKSCHG